MTGITMKLNKAGISIVPRHHNSVNVKENMLSETVVETSQIPI